MRIAMRSLLKIRRAFVTGGVSNVVRLAAARLRRRAADARLATSSFDQRYGTQTSGKIDQLDLDTQAFPNWWHAAAYQAAGAELIQELIAATGIDPSAHAFVDLGSGKGRMVLAAAEAGFAKSIGVEFSASLVAAARQNLAAYAARAELAARAKECDVEFHHADASAFELPSRPLIAFLYNPFAAPVMREVALRAAANRRANPHPLSIWYHHPLCADCWDEAGFVRTSELPEQDAIVWSAPIAQGGGRFDPAPPSDMSLKA